MTTLHRHTEKMKNVNSKKCQSNVKIIFKKNHLMKNLVMKCIEIFLICIFLIDF
jgi:hypothetical protein